MRKEVRKNNYLAEKVQEISGSKNIQQALDSKRQSEIYHVLDRRAERKEN